MTVLIVLPIPAAVFIDRAVFEIQRVLSHAVSPKLDLSVESAKPNLIPATVTDQAPLATTLEKLVFKNGDFCKEQFPPIAPSHTYSRSLASEAQSPLNTDGKQGGYDAVSMRRRRLLVRAINPPGQEALGSPLGYSPRQVPSYSSPVATKPYEVRPEPDFTQSVDSIEPKPFGCPSIHNLKNDFDSCTAISTAI